MNYVDRAFEEATEYPQIQVTCGCCGESFECNKPKRGLSKQHCPTCRANNQRAAEKLSRDKRAAGIPPIPQTGRAILIHDRRSFWTDDRATAAQRLWGEGLSAHQIAVSLGGISRNAVIGKLHRLGLTSKDKPQRVATFRPRAPRQPRAYWEGANSKPRQHGPRLDCDAVQGLPPDHSDCAKPFMEIGRDECRYPVSREGEPFIFCAAASWGDGEPYCLRHHQLTHKFTAGPKRPWREGRRAA